MSHKHLMFRGAAREKILMGTTALNDAVRVTLGPRSKCVLIERKWGKPLVCNDGVTIAREFDLKDPEMNLGAQMIRDAAEKTGDIVGDGTSTATVLAHAIFSEGLRNVAAGASSIDLKRGLDKGLMTAIDAIKNLSKPIISRLEKAQVATISAHNDPSMGELVADAMETIGRDGVITVEEAKSTETALELVDGMQFDRGYISPYFITNPDKMITVLEDPFILLFEKKVTQLADLLPLLEILAKEGKNFLIIAGDIEGEALATLVLNKMRGLLKCAAVKAPGFGDRQKQIMEDLAVLTGGQFICDELGVKLENVSLEHLGRAQRVEITKDTTMIIGGAGDKDKINSRIESIRAEINQVSSDYDREKLKNRLAKLTGGVAVIKVGAASEAELKSRKEAFDDAINATKAAVEEGIVPGGGLALLRASDALRALEITLHGDELTGVRILKRALEAPARQIAENSSADGGVIIAKMREGTGNFGFDAAQRKFVDLVEVGIVDPTKVVRIALENAVSVAGILLLADATLTEIQEEKQEFRPEHVGDVMSSP
jgi:chaperonin GroEL